MAIDLRGMATLGRLGVVLGTLTLWLAGRPAWAGEAAPCDRYKVGVDKFTGQVALATKGTAQTKHRQWTMVWTASWSAADGPSWSIWFPTKGVSNQTLPAGFEVQVLMDSGKLVTLTTSEDTAPVPEAASSMLVTRWLTRLVPSPEAVSELQASPIDTVRVELPSGVLDLPMSGGDKKSLQQLWSCMADLSEGK